MTRSRPDEEVANDGQRLLPGAAVDERASPMVDSCHRQAGCFRPVPRRSRAAALGEGWQAR